MGSRRKDACTHPFRSEGRDDRAGKGEVIVDNWGEDRATASLKDQGLEAVALVEALGNILEIELYRC